MSFPPSLSPQYSWTRWPTTGSGGWRETQDSRYGREQTFPERVVSSRHLLETCAVFLLTTVPQRGLPISVFEGNRHSKVKRCPSTKLASDTHLTTSAVHDSAGFWFCCVHSPQQTFTSGCSQPLGLVCSLSPLPSWPGSCYHGLAPSTQNANLCTCLPSPVPCLDLPAR